MEIKVPMLVRLYAGDVLVAEVDDPGLFSATLAEILPKCCPLCHQTPDGSCCHQSAAHQEVK